MTQPSTPTDNRRVLRGDILFTCSMLFACCLFISGLIAAPLWEFEERQKIISANTTATAIVRTTEQAQYDFIERFNTNKNRWRVGGESSEYWIGSTKIEKGVYAWDITETKDTFIAWADFSGREYIKDFDAYVDTKVEEGGLGDVCSGLLFRISLDGWDAGGYYFALCNNSWTTISYHTEKDGWERIASLQYEKRYEDWNRLEISARGSHFQFFINGNEIYEMEDDRVEVGSLAIVIELNETVPAKVLFDNFGFQNR